MRLHRILYSVYFALLFSSILFMIYRYKGSPPQIPLHLLTERQKLLQSVETYDVLYKAYISEIKCPKLVRLGNRGDGGKWTCNPDKLPTNCLIYSLGIGYDVSFESHLNLVTHNRCKIFAFDTIANTGRHLAGFPNVVFRPWEIKTEDSDHSIPKIMKMFRHEKIDFFKIDVEGGEFKILEEMFSMDIKPCQIFVEIHPGSGRAKKMVELLRTISRAGYLNFAKEINGVFSYLCEFSFIHERCIFNYDMAEVLQKNFID